MNFPLYSPDQAHVLPDIVNIMLACCLAMYPDSSKKPVLQLRVKLMVTIHSLKARGSPMDLYTFCTSNMSLLRIAMIEYFVYFISSFMPNETSMLTTVFGLQQDIADIFRQFTIICDTFRHQSMQDHVLDLSDINLKAQVAIGTCLARANAYAKKALKGWTSRVLHMHFCWQKYSKAGLRVVCICISAPLTPPNASLC